MEIRLGSLLTGAREAVGTVVLIDVYRAFTTAPVMFLRGADKIVMVGETKDALALKRRGVGDLCIGEIGGERPDGFDHGNSPFEMARTDLAGKTVIQSTRAGTVGVEAARKADRIYAGSLVMAEATAAAILEDDPSVVSIVAMGWEGRARTDEDEQCAFYL
ncbi:MAG: 2-phosphosulfolactate phosphatase, partial [Candidatus Latescibacteria bacterium]|nr:2-phosphosulfolactate phosphatase [Candidatus Latescibacterota bacterium]